MQVYKALMNLMRYVGREEVDRVYKIMFGVRPGEKDSR